MHLVLALWLSSLGQTPAPVENVSSFPPRSAFEERKALHVPEGFEVQLVAAEPAIQKPMNIAFDDRGRLWVTGTVEYPYAVAAGKTGRDTVKILEDFQPDGRAGKITTFAEGLNIPIGLLPLPGGQGALIYSIPTIDRFLDTDGDGKADKREPLYKAYGYRDTHGMTGSFSWGFDGWLYACHGFANESQVEGADKSPIKMSSGNTYRMKVDGSHAEYFTHGQVNPFGLTFDPLGNLYSSDCHSKPIYLLLRGGYYPSFGKPDDGLGFAPDMIAHDHGSTAIDGATFYAADQYPERYRGSVFIGNVVTNRVNHDLLEWHGSSPKAIEQTDFVWSEDNWFRPVDIELGPDGALYIADFYNKIIGHYEVPLTHPDRDHDHGRIWRIVYKGADGKGKAVQPRADWAKATVAELIEDLGHPNLVVRTYAANQLVLRQDAAIDSQLTELVTSPADVWRRVHGLWVLQRRGKLGSPTLEKVATDTAYEVRVHAMRMVGEREAEPEALNRLARAGLNDTNAFVKRSAADALGRHPEIENVRPLLDARQAAPADDTHLIHVARMALRDQLLQASAWKALDKLSLNERDRRDIADVANGVPTADAAAFLLNHIETAKESSENQARYVHHIARNGSPETTKPLVAFVQAHAGEGLVRQSELLKAIQQGLQERGAPLTPEISALAVDLTRSLLDSAKDSEKLLGISLASSFQLRDLSERLEALAKDGKLTENARTESLTALVGMDPKKAIGVLGVVLVDASSPIVLRERAATSLAAIDQAESRGELLKALPTAPDRLQTTIAAGLAARKAGAEALLETVTSGKASARLLQEQRVAGPLANAGIPMLKEKLDTLLQGLPPADQRLKELLEKRRAAFVKAPGNVEEGAKIFEKNCAACHQIGGKGARVGPQLDGVGNRGVERLLEDVLDPSRNVDQAFRVTNLALSDGRVVTGLLLKEEGAVLVLADSQGKEVRIPTNLVEERSTAQSSPMPANFVDQITEAQFYDLLAYLLSQKQEPKAASRELNGFLSR
ncbi:PVC-type heme-binding CxxCH protein [Singulisphaera sp. PoT]|uniref:PVC-type heme-binding CxxCH protein n=1 Tax=Singulisphaera sp. PoT TaxID=3411797 RepID=UPI003BF4BEC6